MHIAFKETQKITQWWILLSLIGLALFFLYGIYQQLILDIPFGSNPMSNIGLFITVLLLLIFMCIIIVIRLETEIDEHHLSWSFKPFMKKNVSWSEVKKAEVIQYGFVGGWGIRLFTKYGTFYSLKGNKGFAIELKNGKKILIGTQRESELRELISTLGLN